MTDYFQVNLLGNVGNCTTTAVRFMAFLLGESHC